MYRKTIFSLIMFMAMISLVPAPVAAAPPDEEGQNYVVQADDWLSKLADKFYGAPLVYPVIVEATNLRAAQDGSFTRIDDPDLIRIGQKLFIPPIGEISEAFVESVREETAMPDDVIVTHDGPSPEQLELLANLAVKGSPPELFNEVWLNSEPLKLTDLRGKVVIVEFWTFG